MQANKKEYTRKSGPISFFLQKKAMIL